MIRAYYYNKTFDVVCVDTFHTKKQYNASKNEKEYLSASLFDKHGFYVGEIC